MSTSIGARIAAVRKMLKLTQKELAEQLGISQQHVSHIENGTKEASDMLIKYFCYLYSISEEWLTTGEGRAYMSPEEIIKKQIDQIGEKAYFKALHNIIDKSDPAIWGPVVETIRSPDLDHMISYLVKLWEVGDEDLKAWARVQFAMAFPYDIEALIEKKRAKLPTVPKLIPNITSNINKDDI